ncbi:hypothetical protein ACP3VS_22795 [Lysinibacillus sp. VIII_CA]
MKDATVTISYESFQDIKKNADKYEKLVQAKEDVLHKKKRIYRNFMNLS